MIAILQSINGFMVLPAIKYLFGRALRPATSPTSPTAPADIFSHPVSVLLLVVIAIIAWPPWGCSSWRSWSWPTASNRACPGCRGLGPGHHWLHGQIAQVSLAADARVLLSPWRCRWVGWACHRCSSTGSPSPPFVTREYLKAPLSIGIYALMIGAIIYVNLQPGADPAAAGHRAEEIRWPRAGA